MCSLCICYTRCSSYKCWYFISNCIFCLTWILNYSEQFYKDNHT
uniref:Uncharacterized protein n=1 Tax=Octopus bimaculoides TaxID=37653 RepID=A0A0L8GU05_OCTBM